MSEAVHDLGALIAGRDTRWYRGHFMKLNLCIFLVIITSMTNGYDGSMMNGLQTLEAWRWYFKNPQGGLLGVFNAIQYIGALPALLFASQVTDYFGRRRAIAFGSAIMLVGVALQSASKEVGMFIGGRALIGFGLTFATNAAPALITEIAYPTHRAPLTGLYNSTWYLGAIVAAWTTYGTFRIGVNEPTSAHAQWSWRIPSIVQAVPSVLQILLIWFVPESPRWLVAKGRDEEARRIFAKYHCGGDLDDPLVEFEYQEVKQALEAQKIANSSTWKSLWSTKGNLRRMRVIIAIGFFSQWSGNGLVSYYLSVILTSIGIKSTSSQALLNGILQLYNYGTAIVGSLVVDKTGRRPLFLTSTGGMFVVFCIWTACSAVYSESAKDVDALGNALHPNKSAGNAVVAAIFFYYGFYNIAMSPLLASYTAEILPFAIRTKGLVVSSVTVDAALVFNQYLNPIALGKIGWKYYIVYDVWLLFEFLFLYRYIIETKGGKTLEEISLIFDGQEVAEKLQADAAAAAAGHIQHEGDFGVPYKGGSGEYVNEKDEKPVAGHIERV